MVALAFNPFRRAPVAPPAPQDRFVPGDAELLRGLSGAIALPWALFNGLVEELARLAGTRSEPPRPEVRFFPIAIELAAPGLRDSVASELADLIAMLDPAVESLDCRSSSGEDVAATAQALLERAKAARDRMVAAAPSEETA